MVLEIIIIVLIRTKKHTRTHFFGNVNSIIFLFNISSRPPFFTSSSQKDSRHSIAKILADRIVYFTSPPGISQPIALHRCGRDGFIRPSISETLTLGFLLIPHTSFLPRTSFPRPSTQHPQNDIGHG